VPARCAGCGGAAFVLPDRGAGRRRYRCRDCGGEHETQLDPGRIYGGALFALAGTAAMWAGLSGGDNGAGQGPVWPAVGVGLVFLMAGLLIMGAGGWVYRRWLAHLPVLGRIPWSELLGGGVALLAGVGLFLVAALDSREDAFPAGRLPVVMAGGAFFLAGVAILYQAFSSNEGNTRATRVIGLLLLACLLGIPAAIFLDWRTIKLLALVASSAWLAWWAWRLGPRDILPRRIINTPLALLLAAVLPMLVGVAFGAGWWLHRLLTPTVPQSALPVAGGPGAPTGDIAGKPAEAPPGADLEVRCQLQVWGEGTATPAGRIVLESPLRPRPGEKYWITVVPAGRGDGTYEWWQYVEPGTVSLNLPAPDLPGEYEVRLLARYPSEPYHVIWRESWTLHPPPAEAGPNYSGR